MTTFNFFASKNKCTKIVTDTLPNINKSDNSYVVTEKHGGGVNGNEVWIYKVMNGGHDWPGSSGNMDISASEEVLHFFKRYLSIDNLPK